jgi:itaconyl-CoA hydratase
MNRSHVQIGPDRYRECYGLVFEDLERGLVFDHRPGITVHQIENAWEALTTLNQAMVHFDDHYSAQTEFGRPLVVSTLTVQRLVGMTWRTFGQRRRIRSFPEIRMTAPVFGGTTLYARSTVIEVDETPDGATGNVLVSIEGYDATGRTVAVLRAWMEVYRATTTPSDPTGGSGTRPFASHRQEADGRWIEVTGVGFEDFRQGQVFEHRPGRRFTAADAWLRSALAGEQTAALIDPDVAPLAHDGAAAIPETLLITAGATASTKTLGRVVANLGWTDIAVHRRPDDGEVVYAESEILEVRDSRSRPDQGILRVATRGVDGSGQPIFSFERSLLVYRTGQGPYAAAGY